jgi:hypothetical protein
VVTKYPDILKRFQEHLPPSEEERAASNKDYPHKLEDITLKILTSKLKAIQMKYRQAVDSGKKSGHGRVVLCYFELCQKIWGGSPAGWRVWSFMETMMRDLTAAVIMLMMSNLFVREQLQKKLMLLTSNMLEMMIV